LSYPKLKDQREKHAAQVAALERQIEEQTDRWA
jgi:hypothetical protein